MNVMKYRKDWHQSSFREKHPSDLKVGELVWSKCVVFPGAASGPCRIVSIDGWPHRRIMVEIVGRENSGLFDKGWNPLLVPRYR